MKENKKTSRKRSVAKRITALAMMTALSVVLGIVCKNLFTIALLYRFTLENLGVIMAGIFFGPFYGAAVGIASDLISCLLSTNPVPIPLITAGAATVGLVSGVVSRALRRLSFGKRCVIAAISAHLTGQVIIKSVAKMIVYHMPWYGIFIGLGFSVVAVIIETRVIVILSKNRQIMEFINRNDDL